MNKLTNEEFEIKYNEYRQFLFNLAYSYTLNVMDSEDIIQDVFIKYYNNKNNFNDVNHEKNWLVRVTINSCINFLKHRNKKDLLISNDYINNLPDTSDADTKNEDLRTYVNMLDYKYRTVIILFYYDNYSIKDISNILNISENSIKVRLNRARVKLKELVGDKKWLKKI